jgi:hypothetical protein
VKDEMSLVPATKAELAVASLLAERTLAARETRLATPTSTAPEIPPVDRNPNAPPFAPFEGDPGDPMLAFVNDLTFVLRRMLTEGTGLNFVTVEHDSGYWVQATEIDFGPMQLKLADGADALAFHVTLIAANESMPGLAWLTPEAIESALLTHGWEPPSQDPTGQCYIRFDSIISSGDYQRIALDIVKAMLDVGCVLPFQVSLAVEHWTDEQIADHRRRLSESASAAPE